MIFNFNLFAVLRQQKGLTIYAVADRLGVKASTISRWERGLTQPYQKQLKLIARLFRRNQSEFQITLKRGKPNARKKNTSSVAGTEN
jgi:transcriptional regulator with XRE-family HTH domain